MEYVIDTALDNLGCPQYIDGALMSWMDDGLEDSIRGYLGIDGTLLLPPQAQNLYSSILSDTTEFCYELCAFFANAKIPIIGNASVYTTKVYDRGFVVLELMDRETLKDYVDEDPEGGDYGAALF